MRRLIAAAMLAVAGTARAQGDTTPLDTLYQTYEEGPISLPYSIGLRIPTYDRVNGLSLPWGPHIAIPGGRVELDPTVTYRSNLGDWDPAIKGSARFGHFDVLDVFGGRGTFTNDEWIRSDIINSLTSIGVGTDARNYYRADKVRADFSHRIEGKLWTTKLWVGGNHEFDWSTGLHPEFGAVSATTLSGKSPWSFFGRKDDLKMRRPNPEIFRGHITSILGGAEAQFERGEMKAKLSGQIERALDQPSMQLLREAEKFTQLALDARTSFPTFGLQTFEFKGHFVTSWSDVLPQRYVYLGGAGTLSTVDLLQLGGDRLFFVRADYNVPLVKPVLPYVGAPVLSAMYSAGSAGVKELPDFIQNIGAAVGLKVIKIEYWIDPNYKKTSFTHKSKFSIGFSLSL